ncbi:chemotaxis protein CheW [Cellulomonas sp. URHD0024]|uniref:chemotaxis protein CheW n=1 Tax=Cellulomonas sp. URHD0024 TaxID=1302620 RepID=UPI00040D6969|nr:chemotaxis protein CheW [Cellulomonas sp. URHD0024]
MTTTTYHLPSRRVPHHPADVLETIYTAPAPVWGTSAAQHGRYVGYLVGSIVVWTLLPLLVTGAIGALLSI